MFAPERVSLPGEIFVRALVPFVPLMMPLMVASAPDRTSSVEVPVASVHPPLKVTGFAKVAMIKVLAARVTMALPMLIGTVAVRRSEYLRSDVPGHRARAEGIVVVEVQTRGRIK